MFWQTPEKFLALILVLTVFGILSVSLYNTGRVLRPAYLFSAGCGTIAGMIAMLILLFMVQAFFSDKSRDINAVEFFFIYLAAPVGGILGLMVCSIYVLVDELYYEKARKVLILGGLPILLVYLPFCISIIMSSGISSLTEIDDVGLYMAYLLFGLVPILLTAGTWRWISQKSAS